MTCFLSEISVLNYKSEISKYNLAEIFFIFQQDIGGFNVSMNVFLRVEVGKGRQK